MNYRHAFHAGNFADVAKHAIFTLVIEHLKRKPAPFRVIDTHAGTGAYDLESDEAARTGEAAQGIARLLEAKLAPEAADLLASYLSAVAKFNGSGPLKRYPGSPMLARRLMRPSDTLVANELHPQDRARLQALFKRDKAVKVMGIDGWVALKSLLPPKERRGVTLIDPPFENADEFEQIVSGLSVALRRFATGTYLLWYPIKDETRCARFKKALVDLGTPNILDVQLRVRGAHNTNTFDGSGTIIVNPPFELDKKLQVLMPELARTLSQADGATATVNWLTPST